ncbi:hypothetical protein ABZ590_16485 [Streptomyces hirsutus]
MAYAATTIEEARKAYGGNGRKGGRPALDGLDLTVARGTVRCVLGLVVLLAVIAALDQRTGAVRSASWTP